MSMWCAEVKTYGYKDRMDFAWTWFLCDTPVQYFCFFFFLPINTLGKGAGGHDPVAMWAAMVTGLSNPTPLLWLVQLLLWPHPSGPQLTAATPPCPTPCSCSNQASRVICTRRGLAEVPDSISENTRYLNLQENSIKVTTMILYHCILYHYILQI